MNKKREVKDLIETLHDTLLIRLTHTHATRTHLTQPEHTLNNTQLRRSSIETSHSQPVVNDHPSTNNGATTVHTTSDKGHLQQGRKFVLVTDGGLGVDDTALVGEGHVGACQDVVGDGLAEDFDAKNVGDSTQLASIPFTAQYREWRGGGGVYIHFLGLTLDIRMHKGDMVIAANDISQCRETLFYPLDLDVVGKGIPQMLQFLVCGCCGDEEAIAVSIRLLTSFSYARVFNGERRTQLLDGR